MSERGYFTIDSDKAVEKLGRLQLPGPHHYLLKFIQAAVAAGAPGVTVEINWLGINLHFVPVQALVLDNLFHHLLAGPTAMRHLAAGVNAALTTVRQVALEQDGRRHLFSRKTTWEEKTPPAPGVRLRVSRFSLDNRESELLALHCAWSPVPITLNGTTLELAHWGPRSGASGQHLAELYLRDGGGLRAPWRSFALSPPRVSREELGAPIPCWAALALRQGPPHSLTLDIVQHGVLIHRHQPSGPPGPQGTPAAPRGPVGRENLWAVVAADDQATDLSGFKVVEDSALEGRISRVREECLRHMMPRMTVGKPSPVPGKSGVKL